MPALDDDWIQNLALDLSRVTEAMNGFRRGIDGATFAFAALDLHVEPPPGWAGPGRCTTHEPPTTNLERRLQQFGLIGLTIVADPDAAPNTITFRERPRTATFDTPGTAAPWWALGWHHDRHFLTSDRLFDALDMAYTTRPEAEVRLATAGRTTPGGHE